MAGVRILIVTRVLNCSLSLGDCACCYGSVMDFTPSGSALTRYGLRLSKFIPVRTADHSWVVLLVDRSRRSKRHHRSDDRAAGAG
jgi:hypothetical protein